MPNALPARLIDLMEADVLAARGRVEADGNAHQSEADRAGPNGSRHKDDYGDRSVSRLFRGRLCRDRLIQLHRVAGCAPGGQTALEQPGIIALASQRAGQSSAGLFV